MCRTCEHVIEDSHVMTRHHQLIHEMRPHESSATSHENAQSLSVWQFFHWRERVHLHCGLQLVDHLEHRRPDLSLNHIPQLQLIHALRGNGRSEEHTSELQSLMRISYAVFCLQKKKQILLLTKKQLTTTINIQDYLT